MVKVTVEENGKILRTMEGDIAVGFVASKDDDDAGSVKNCMFISGGMPTKNIITSLSFLCIEVINALSENGIVKIVQMHLFKKTLEAAESGKAYKVEKCVDKHEFRKGGKE